jgi:thiol:disulfide interchange protein DsbA
MNLKQMLLLLMCVALLGACHKQPPGTDNKSSTTRSAKKSQPSAAIQSDNNSSDSSNADEIPLQLSETDSAQEPETTTSTALALKALQPPQVPASAWKEGVHYKRLSPVQPTSALPGQIEVTEAFWYGSAPCYVLDQSMDVWRKQKASYINFVRLPIMWGSAQRLHARMFYIAELLGKSEEFQAAMYRELQINKVAITNNQQIQAFFETLGVSPEDFKRANGSPAIDASLKHAQIMGDRYRINAVPTIIINGRYVTDAVMAGGSAQLLVLINELAAREKGG